MSGSLAFEPGGVEFNVVEVDGAEALNVTLAPDVLDGALYDLVLTFVGLGAIGVSDIFCVPPVPDIYKIAPIRDLFYVPPGRRQC